MKACVSLWSADLLDVGRAIDLVGPSADAFHIDVFDGNNVPELLFGPDFVAAVRRRTTLPIDVHLNVLDPDYWARRFIDVGADMITMQAGASADIQASLAQVRTQGVQPSLGLELHEPIGCAVEHFDLIDRVLVMGTEIGVKGKGLDPATPDRVAALCSARQDAGRDRTSLGIYVDGGIRAATIDALAEAGADGVIPGSLVFGVADPLGAIAHLHDLGASASTARRA